MLATVGEWIHVLDALVMINREKLSCVRIPIFSVRCEAPWESNDLVHGLY